MLAPTLTNLDITQAQILALPTEYLTGQANLFKQISKEFEISIDAEIKKSGGFIIHGRSDTTLNPGGVRLGTAEIYSEVEKFKAVKESFNLPHSFGFIL